MKISSSTHGLGDTLILTSVCRHLINKLTVQIPAEQSRFAILFEGLANVEICQEKDLLPLQDTGDGHYALTKLRTIFGSDAENMDIRPLVLYSDRDSEAWATDYLKDKPNPVIVCPFVAKQWSQVRDLPLNIAEEIIHGAKLRGQTPIVIQSNSSHKWSCDTLNDLELRKLICLMRKAGFYAGANTGLYPLAIALGCMVECYQPQDNEYFQSYQWCYSHPTIKHFTWLRS